jgi:transposase, IS5 family
MAGARSDVLRTEAGQTGSLFDLVLPEPLRDLPADLAAIDELLQDDQMLAPFRAHWDEEVKAGLIGSTRCGRPTIPMATYVRLMVLKHRYGWGYEVLVREVSDSLHLRRFCGIALHQDAPDESTVRKMTRRLGHDVVDELIRELIKKASGERRIRIRAMRCDSTVLEADIRFPTDINLVGDAVRTLTRVAGTVKAALPDVTATVRDRGRAVGKRLRELGRTLQRRTGEARSEVERLTTESTRLLHVTIREARRLLTQSLHKVQTMAEQPTRAQVRTVLELAQFVARAELVAEQVRRRFAEEPITDRLVSIFDIHARPIRKGKAGSPTEFGYVVQLTELTPNTKRGARGLLLPPTMHIGNSHENELLPDTVTELGKVDASPKEAAFDGGFTLDATRTTMADTGSEVFIVGSKKNAGSRRHQRRLARYRVGCEGRVSHLKREFSARRSRLKGAPGAHIWTSWSVLSYNLYTLAGLPVRR